MHIFNIRCTSANNEFISLTLEIIHDEISGKYCREDNSANIVLIVYLFDISHFDNAGKYCKEEQPLKVKLISFIFEVFQNEFFWQIYCRFATIKYTCYIY